MKRRGDLKSELAKGAWPSTRPSNLTKATVLVVDAGKGKRISREGRRLGMYFAVVFMRVRA